MVVVTLTPPRKKMVDIISKSTKSNKYKIEYCNNIYNIKSRLEKKICHIFTMYKISMHNNIQLTQQSKISIFSKTDYKMTKHSNHQVGHQKLQTKSIKS